MGVASSTVGLALRTATLSRLAFALNVSLLPGLFQLKHSDCTTLNDGSGKAKRFNWLKNVKGFIERNNPPPQLETHDPTGPSFAPIHTHTHTLVVEAATQGVDQRYEAVPFCFVFVFVNFWIAFSWILG